MENNPGYQELLILSHQLESRAQKTLDEADFSQSEGMNVYLSSQEKSLEQARATLQKCEEEVAELTEVAFETADKKLANSLMEAYGKYGVEVH